MAKRSTALRCGELKLIWFDTEWTTCYALYRVGEDGQIAHVADFEQGPFDTALEVSQWAWRHITRQIPPSVM